MSERKEAKLRGLKRYYTGNACPHGHIDQRFTSNGRCVTCIKKGLRIFRQLPGPRARKLALDHRYYERHKEKHALQAKEWAANFKKLHGRSPAAERIRHDPKARFVHLFRIKFRAWMKGHKNAPMAETVGCAATMLRELLGKQFLPGMHWQNYGSGKDQWSIDHILPLAKFNPYNPEDQKKAWHYSNLRPLWHIDNLKKGARIQ